jgi:hypothetical protein
MNVGAGSTLVQDGDIRRNGEGLLEHVSLLCLEGGEALPFSPLDAARTMFSEMRTGDASETPQPFNDDIYTNLPSFHSGNAFTISPFDAARAALFEAQTDRASELSQPFNENQYANLPSLEGENAFNFSPWDASRAPLFEAQAMPLGGMEIPAQEWNQHTWDMQSFSESIT